MYPHNAFNNIIKQQQRNSMILHKLKSTKIIAPITPYVTWAIGQERRIKKNYCRSEQHNIQYLEKKHIRNHFLSCAIIKRMQFHTRYAGNQKLETTGERGNQTKKQ